MIFPSLATLERYLSRPGFYSYVKSAYHLGGYEVSPGINLDITDGGLDWVRTLNLTHRERGYTMQVIHPEDIHVVVGYVAGDLAASRYGQPGPMV